MHELGRIISKHGASRSTSITTMGFGLLLCLLGIALLPFSFQVEGQDRLVVLSGTALLLAIGGGLMLLWLFIKPKATYTLYEKGIAVSRKGTTESLRFEDITELHRARVGKSGFPLVGFRTHEGHPWNIIEGTVSGSGKLSTALREAHVSYHLPPTLERLSRGSSLAFKHVPRRDRLAARFLSWNVEDHFRGETETMFLDSASLKIGTSIFPISEMASLEMSDWTSALTIRGRNGQELLSMDFVSIYNGDLFVTTLEELTRKNTSGKA